MFRLTSRRFIQELFQDVQFMPVRTFNKLSETLHLCVDYTIYYIILSSFFFFLDVRGSRGNPEKATKTCWRGRWPSCGILIVVPLVFPTWPKSCHPTKMTWENLRYGSKDRDVSVAENRKSMPRKGRGLPSLTSSQHKLGTMDAGFCKQEFNLTRLMLS